MKKSWTILTAQRLLQQEKETELWIIAEKYRNVCGIRKGAALIQNSVLTFWIFAMIMMLIRLYAVWEKITCLRGARYDDFENVNMHCL